MTVMNSNFFQNTPKERKEYALLHWILFIYPFEIKIATEILGVRSSRTIGFDESRSLRWIAEAESGRAAFFCNSMSSVWWKPRWMGFMVWGGAGGAELHGL